MKIQPYIERLNLSEQYKDFTKSNKDAFMMAGFFILDFENGKHIHQIDYYVPSKKKVAAFTLDGKVTLQLLDAMTSKKPEKLDLKTKIDLDALQGILQDEMKNRSMTEKIQKIIAIVQNIEGKKIWNLNCVLSGMGILRAHVEDESRTVLKMEKASIFDFIKKMPTSALKGMAQQQEETGQPAQVGEVDSKDKMKKLEELEKAIEEEKKSILAQAQLTKAKKAQPEKVKAKKSSKG